jgi:hypothetical protein
MKELIEKIIEFLPKYFVEFATCFSRPKRFMGKKNTDTESFMSDALLFLAISLVIFTLLSAVTVETNNDIWTQLIRHGVYFILSVIATAAAIRIAWLIVGGKASFRSYFTTSAYFLGVGFVLVSIALAMYAGAIKSFYPAMSREILQEANIFSMFSQTGTAEVSLPDNGMGAAVAVLILFLGVLGLIIWTYIAWGIYRVLNNAGKIRSFFAGVMATLITFVFTIPIVLVDAAFM